MDQSRQDQLENRLSLMETGLSRRLSETSWLAHNDNEFFRTEICGLAAELVKRESERLGYPARLLLGTIRHPDYLGSRRPQDQHVVCLVEDELGSTIVDANYSQFFKPFGLDIYLMRETTSDPFPGNRLLVIGEDEIESAAQWCAEYVGYFWKQELYSPEFQVRHGYTTKTEDEKANLMDHYNRNSPPIRQLSTRDLIDYFANIWDLDNYEDYVSPPDAISWLDDYEALTR